LPASGNDNVPSSVPHRFENRFFNSAQRLKISAQNEENKFFSAMDAVNRERREHGIDLASFPAHNRTHGK
jgi:hypothetical protein